jgi:flavin reductase (DIM6/NTAB) family NADH-FMN oxidoreductase RutF
MTVSADEFKKALQFWASGIAVVTTFSEKLGAQGMTVTAFSSVSVEPPQILVCINENADTGEGIDASQCFAVNVLSSAQQSLSNQFAGGLSQAERFATNPWETAVTGAPILSDTLVSLDCKVVEKVKAGTHWIIIGSVQACISGEGDPVLYYRSGYRQLLNE